MIVSGLVIRVCRILQVSVASPPTAVFTQTKPVSGVERWEGRGMMQSSNCIRLLGIWCLSLNHYNTLTHNPISAPLSSGISHDFLIMNENMWSNSVVWACSDSLGQPLMHLSNVETQKCILKCLSCLIPADTNYFVPFCQMTNLLRLLKKNLLDCMPQLPYCA